MLTPISLWDGFDFSQPTKANMLSEIRYDNVIHREYFFSGIKHAASAPETVIAKIKNKLKTIAAKLPITLLFRTS